MLAWDASVPRTVAAPPAELKVALLVVTFEKLAASPEAAVAASRVVRTPPAAEPAANQACAVAVSPGQSSSTCTVVFWVTSGVPAAVSAVNVSWMFVSGSMSLLCRTAMQ